MRIGQLKVGTVTTAMLVATASQAESIDRLAPDLNLGAPMHSTAVRLPALDIGAPTGAMQGRASLQVAVVVRHGGAVHGRHGGVAWHGGAVARPGWHGGGVAWHGGAVVRPGWHGGGVRWGGWARPSRYWWGAGGAIAAGAAIGFVSAAAAASWAGAAPGPGLCWYYTDPSQTNGFWDACP
jgi:hypothetical protein